MNPLKYFFVMSAASVVLLANPLYAENEGLADLDQATDAKLTANSLQDITKVIGLLESAIAKGLDDDNKAFAKKLLAATLIQRATALAQVIFDEAGPDPRWPQFRKAALADLERAVTLDEDQPQAHWAIARLYALPGGDRDKAIAALDHVVASETIDEDTKVKALTLRGGLQTDDARRLADYDQAIELAPDDPEPIRARGLFHMLKKNSDQAVADLSRSIELDPDNASSYEALGIALLAAEKLDEALQNFNQGIEHAPNSVVLYTHRARVHAAKDDFQAALKDLDKALELAPDSLEVRLHRAQLFQESGDLDAAVAEIDKAIEQKPGWLQGLRLRAELLAGSGKVEEAIQGLERLKEAVPTNPDVQFQLATYYLANQQPRLAIKTLDAVLAGNVKNWRALRIRGDAHLSIAQQAEAIADYEAALKIEPAEDGILNNLAWVLATSPDEKLRDGERAIELAKKAAEATKYEQGHILSTLAAAYAETGDFETARQWSTKAVEIGREDQKEQLTQELESYKQEKPWREVQNIEKDGGEEKTAEKPGSDTTKDR